MPSPICTVNALATTNGVDVAAASTPTIALADVGGVSQWALTCVGTDELNSAASVTAGLSINQVNKTATFTAPAAGSALIFQSKINNGQDINGRVVPEYTTTFAVFVLLANGQRVAAVNETTEGDATFGWTSKYNQFVRAMVAPATLLPAAKAVRAAATTNITLSGGTTVIDGVTMTTGDRLLAAGQTTASENGIYVWVSGIWARAADFDGSSEVYGGVSIYVQEGTSNAKKIFVCTNTGTVILNSTNITFAELTALGSTSFNGRGTVAGSGVLRTANNTTAVAAKTSGGNDLNLLGCDGSNNIVVGEDADAATIQLRSSSTGAVTCYANNVAFLTVTPLSFSYTPVQGAGAGAASSLRGQKGAAGSSGGHLSLGGGDPGTAGTGHAGDTIVKLGAIENPGDLKSAALLFDSNGTSVGKIYYNAGTFMFESIGSQLAVVSAGIAQLASGNNTYVDGPTDVHIRTGGSPTDKILADTTGVTLFASAGSYGSGSKVLFVANCSAAPSGSPTGGGILYAESGAGKWKGSSGTVTTFGPAEPHCPSCGRDFAHEWRNEANGEALAVCAPCMLTELGRVGVDVSKFAFIRELGA